MARYGKNDLAVVNLTSPRACNGVHHPHPQLVRYLGIPEHLSLIILTSLSTPDKHKPWSAGFKSDQGSKHESLDSFLFIH